MKKLLLIFAAAAIAVAGYFYYFSSVKTPDNGADLSDLIQVSYPKPGQKITSPLKISGKARGYWFFEASFPVILTDWDGKIIAEHYAKAEGEWMTEEFVSFTSEIKFEKPAYGERGFLILKKDNPSDRRELDDSISIPVNFR
ncbi:MAG: Gmad2 immunoglobulin-like domain-containing protein [Patescibacteria group bacterium]